MSGSLFLSNFFYLLSFAVTLKNKCYVWGSTGCFISQRFAQIQIIISYLKWWKQSRSGHEVEEFCLWSIRDSLLKGNNSCNNPNMPGSDHIWISLWQQVKCANRFQGVCSICEQRRRRTVNGTKSMRPAEKETNKVPKSKAGAQTQTHFPISNQIYVSDKQRQKLDMSSIQPKEQEWTQHIHHALSHHSSHHQSVWDSASWDSSADTCSDANQLRVLSWKSNR